MTAAQPADPHSAPASSAPLKRTPLHAQHVAAGARMVPFAGYDMPVHYPLGVLKEHLWTREKAGLFDVSHMGQAYVHGPDRETTARALEALVPADLAGLAPGQIRYSQLLNDSGGMIDDLMIRRPALADMDAELWMVVNAGCKEADYAHIGSRLPKGCGLVELSESSLLALQGPRAAAALARLVPGVEALKFMTYGRFTLPNGRYCQVMRSSYAGEDGYEISLSASDAPSVWAQLLENPDVQPIGLGARDSLRLEAGLPLYGHDIDSTTSPIEAGFAWSIGKRRREQGGFPGAARITAELAQGAKRVRVGILPEGKAPAREGTEILSAAGDRIGVVTSGGFAPSLNAPIAMGYIPPAHAASGTALHLVVRGKPLPARVTKMPFVPHRYVR